MRDRPAAARLPAADDVPAEHLAARGYLLEHPAEAFEAYRREGLDRVICEEKHMGSRAVVLLARDAARFGAPAGWRGVVHTRTGRPFFDEETTRRSSPRLDARRGARRPVGGARQLLAALRRRAAAVVGQGRRLIRDQYASVGLRRPLHSRQQCTLLEQAAATGVDVSDLLDADASTGRGRRRLRRAPTASTAAPSNGWRACSSRRSRCSPRPGRATFGRDHAWHLAIADRLAAAEPELIRPTRTHRGRPRPIAASEAAATTWWEELTGAGGEGMVVKPCGQSRPRREGARAAGHQGARARVPAHHLRPRLHGAAQPRRACATATSATSARWRCASTRSVSRRSSGSSPVNRSGGCTRPSSACSRWSPSPIDPRL